MIGISVAANKERNCVREYFKDSMMVCSEEVMIK